MSTLATTEARLRCLGELAERLPSSPGRGQQFDTAAFVRRMACLGDAEPAPQEVVALDRLCKKIDVVGRLASHYTADLSRAAHAAPVQPEAAAALCGVLLIQAARRCDAKFLNTALRMLDGRLTAPVASFPDFLGAWADGLLAGWSWPFESSDR